MAAGAHDERTVLLREFVVSALYLSLALWATALIIPPEVLPSKWILVALSAFAVVWVKIWLTY
ncbi:MAG: hypothetical protein LPK38_07760 [Actinomycetes bacterium]|nr:hypothetical protein [Actinomycetes bacterium]MDX5381169.1 hypothetical protein [Actinomycetes bacterium]MDX5400447.1 hypothetical protein [Actinomycetes bacterium]MDX5450933.1 hypothetical protein [Actinomycetes bacterium]